MSPLFAKIRERRLIEWTVGYLVMAAALFQALKYLDQTYLWPPVVLRVLPVLLAGGFFAVLVMAWHHGERGDQPMTPRESAMLTMILLLTGSAATVVARNAPLSVDRDPTAVEIVDHSVAVLPFINMSGDSANNYFSDGITEEIRDALGRVPELKVAARTSSFAFKGQNADVAQIARALRVAHVLEGSVHRNGDRVRITTQLTDARTGVQVWARRFDRAASDLFAVEEEISRAIADQLGANLPVAQKLVTEATPSPVAHDFYLAALDRRSRGSAAGLHEAVTLFGRAIAADSSYADAHAGLALVYAELPARDPSVAAAKALENARTAARRALRLDPQNAQAHAALSQVAAYVGDFPSAEQEARTALQFNPNYATAHSRLAVALALENRLDDALPAARRALALDPLSPVAWTIHALVLQARGDQNGASDALKRAVQLDPDLRAARTHLAILAYTRGEWALGDEMIRGNLRSAGADSALATTVSNGFTDRLQRSVLLRLLHEPVMQEGLSFAVPVLFELLGQRDSAILAASKIATEPVASTNLRLALLNPAMKGLRDDPRLASAQLNPPLE